MSLSGVPERISPAAATEPTVRAVRGPDGLYRVEGTGRLFDGRIVRADGPGALIGVEARGRAEDGAGEPTEA